MQFSLKSLPSGAEIKRLFVFEKPRADSSGAIPELAVVELLVSCHTLVEGHAVPAGTIGTIVMVHGEGEAFDVEVENPAGIVTVQPGEIRVISSDVG